MELMTVVLATWLNALQPQNPPLPGPAPRSGAELMGKQAVVNTTSGTFVIDLRPDLAPNHVAHFMKVAQSGGFDGTIFHRVILRGIIQGGDPLSKDPAKSKLYGTGGLGVLKAEVSGEKHTRGAVSAVVLPKKPDSAGAQFFVCVSDQPALDGQYSIFGRVSEGMDVVQQVSESRAGPDGRPETRIEIRSVTIRDTPPPEAEPFASEPPASLALYRAVLETSSGPVTVAFLPDKAPEHVRSFLRMASAGVFDGTTFHRVVPGFVVQTGWLPTRGPLTEKQQKQVRPLQPEFNDTRHVKGVLSMARGDDPASATTSFFIVTGDASSLDGKYTAFGRVIDGMSVVEGIEKRPLNGEAPVSRIELKTVRIVK